MCLLCSYVRYRGFAAVWASHVVDFLRGVLARREYRVWDRGNKGNGKTRCCLRKMVIGLDSGTV